jgi:hypothetical protein
MDDVADVGFRLSAVRLQCQSHHLFTQHFEIWQQAEQDLKWDIPLFWHLFTSFSLQVQSHGNM